VAVMRHAAEDRHGWRLRAMIGVLWRAGLRIQEALALAEHDLDERRGSLLVRSTRVTLASPASRCTGLRSPGGLVPARFGARGVAGPAGALSPWTTRRSGCSTSSTCQAVTSSATSPLHARHGRRGRLRHRGLRHARRAGGADRRRAPPVAGRAPGGRCAGAGLPDGRPRHNDGRARAPLGCARGALRHPARAMRGLGAPGGQRLAVYELTRPRSRRPPRRPARLGPGSG
jgi:hypothetical protein